jgi:hypothetical protein
MGSITTTHVSLQLLLCIGKAGAIGTPTGGSGVAIGNLQRVVDGHPGMAQHKDACRQWILCHQQRW